MRTRRTAAVTRIGIGALGIGMVVVQPSLVAHPGLTAAGFGSILLTSLVQLAAPRLGLLRGEEVLATSAAILIVGFGDQRVTVLSLLWLVALATGVMARGGRVGGLGRALVLAALAMPIVLDGFQLSAAYAAFCFAVIGLQLVSGRLTLELNRLLRQARLDAENAETLLLAGDIAARVAHSAGLDAPIARGVSPGPAEPMSAEERADAGRALDALIAGDGMAIAVQPIVELGSRRVHAYEALARFGRRRADRSPAGWFALADELGERVALERACLAAALELFPGRPAGTLLSVNLSVSGLGDETTQELLAAAAAEHPAGLDGLIVEITEEALVAEGGEAEEAIAALRGHGVCIAVDDIGAGYSGLRQITAVVPDYLKLDRSLCAGIHLDADRAALVSALSGYAEKVGSLLVAEGIEQRAELDCLAALGVPLVQGFHLARPGRPWPLVEDAAPALAAAPGVARSPLAV